MSQRRIAILAGGGQLPASCATEALAAGDAVFAITFTGQPQPLNLPPEVEVFQQPLGNISQAIQTLKGQKATHILLAGNLEKASLFTLKPDIRGVKFLAKHALWHDDSLLRSLMHLFEKEGFSMLSVADIAPTLLAPKDVLTKAKPTEKQAQDIQAGFDMLKHLSPLDIGQALIIKNGVILGVEAIEGTNALIERCANLRGKGQGGILVKAAKTQQTEKADLPTIGPKTLQKLVDFNYDGIAIQSGKTIILEQDKVTQIANAHKLFVVGQ